MSEAFAFKTVDMLRLRLAALALAVLGLPAMRDRRDSSSVSRSLMSAVDDKHWHLRTVHRRRSNPPGVKPGPGTHRRILL